MKSIEIIIDESIKSFSLDELKRINVLMKGIMSDNYTDLTSEISVGLRLNIKDDVLIDVRSFTESRSIKITISLIERMWGISHASFSLYDMYLANMQSEGFIKFDLSDSTTTITRGIFCVAGKEDILNSRDREYLAGCFNNHQLLTNFQQSLRIFRYSLAYLLLHEIAHIHFNHSSDVPDYDRITNEKEADLFASDYLLSRFTVRDSSDTEFLETILGVIAAKVFFIFFVLRKHKAGNGAFYEGTHLPLYDRLNNVLEKYAPPSEATDNIWGYLVAVLAMSSTFLKKDVLQGEYSSFYQAAQGYFDLFSE